MTLKRGDVTFSKGQDRLFGHIDQYVLLSVALAFAAFAFARPRHPGNGDIEISVDSEAFPLCLDIPADGVMAAAFREEGAEARTLHILDRRRSGDMSQETAFTRGFNNVLWLPISPIFVDFYERYRPWVESAYGKQSNWPDVFYFARLVRNAISHGGALHFTHDPKRTALWHHLSYDFGHHGTQIIGPRGAFSPADLVFLMMDASDELDRIGCPMAPQ